MIKSLIYATLLMSLYGCGINADKRKANVIFRPPTAYTASFISNDSLNFQLVKHHAFKLYFQEDSYAHKNTDWVKSEIDHAFTRIKHVLGVNTYSRGTHLITVDSENDMEELMGYHIKGGAAKDHDLVFLVCNDTIRPQLKHELFHLIAHEVWGPASSRLLDEGGAMYTDNFCFYDNPMYTINAYFLETNKLFRIHDLVSNFNQQAKENDVIAYVQSAGYFKYLYEEYGIDNIKRLWSEGFKAFESIYGFSIDQLDKEWRSLLTNIGYPRNLDYEMLMVQGCG